MLELELVLKGQGLQESTNQYQVSELGNPMG